MGVNIDFSFQVESQDEEGFFISSELGEVFLKLSMWTPGSVIQLESCINYLLDF